MEEILTCHQKYILARASITSSLSDLEHWFYSVFWEELSPAELRRVHGLLGRNESLLKALGTEQPVVKPDEHEEED